MSFLKKIRPFRYFRTAAICFALFSVTQAVAQPGNALAFDGVDDYVQVPDNSTLDFGAGNFTVEFWVNKRSPSFQYGGVGKWNTGAPAAAGTNEWILTMNTGTNNVPLFWIESGTTIYQANGTYSINFDQWYHIAGVRDGSQIRLYVNGVLEATNTNVGTAAVNNIGRDLLMGKLFSDNPSNEIFDEVRIWNVTRTQAQLQAAKDYSVSPTTPGLLAYYQFQTGTGGGNNAGLTTVSDATANGLNGTLLNFALSGSISNWITSTAPINPVVLPVRYISLQASYQGNTVRVAWNAVGEENMMQYEVQRSAGGAFVTIATQAAMNQNRTSYQWMDANPLTGKALYRIRATDAGGRVQYSTVIPVSPISTTDPAITIYPNPVQGQLISVPLTGKAGVYTVQWFNAAGQKVQSSTITHPGNTYTHMLSVSALPAKGRYSLRISNGADVWFTTSVVRQ